MRLNLAWAILAIVSGLLLLVRILTPGMYQIIIEGGDNPRVYPIPNVYTFSDIIAVCLLSITLGYAVFKAIVIEEKPPFLKQFKISELLRFLKTDELKVYEIIKNSGGIFQSELPEKTGFSTTKVSQVLGFLEVYGLIEKKKKGRENFLRAVEEEPKP
ncbi:MAG: hypothetical protein QXF52_09020 [Thermoproteota archaeon]